MMVNAKLTTGFRPVIQPKLMYNAGSGKLGIISIYIGQPWEE
jgi:hypothetical protein